jgi:hypothetical protein
MVFQQIPLITENRTCSICGLHMQICDHREHHIFTLKGPVELINKLCHCPDRACPASHHTVSPEAELSITQPWWKIGWDVFAWIGHRRFARHWSVGQIRCELFDSYSVIVSEDAIENYILLYQQMVAARHQDAGRLAAEYREVKDLILSIDGLQPEKGHETLYVVRELRLRRVWFAEPLLSSAAEEVGEVLKKAKSWAQRLDRPISLWMSDKQDAFVSGIAEVFPGVPHRYCENHFLRDLAKPVLEADSHAKVALRRKVRGLRSIEREVLAEKKEAPADEAGDVTLDYCAAVRGVLNDDQGGPLLPPGIKMAEALREIRGSIHRNLDKKKRTTRTPGSNDLPVASTEASPRSRRSKRSSATASRTCDG